jgi:molecular chaperone DnaJ
MDLRTAYRVLDAPLGASAASIKALYRRKVAQLHPDRNKSADAHARTTEVNRAFKVIDDAGFPSEAQIHAREGRGSGGRAGAGAGFSGFWSDDGADDSRWQQADWESRRSAYATRSRRGRTVHRKLKLTLEEAIKGKTVTLTGRVAQSCDVCDGSGRAYQKCTTCAGSGRVHYTGNRTGHRACVQCAGSGFRTARCEACHGRGTSGQRPYSARIRIPAGVEPGSTLTAKGSAGRRDGDPSGYKLKVEILEHEVFYFEGGSEKPHLAVVVPIHAIEFLLRESQVVPTPWGDRSVKPTASPWIDVAEAGFPNRSAGRRGPLRVHWDVATDIPEDPALTAELQRLLQRLKARGGHRKRWDEALARWRARVEPAR